MEKNLILAPSNHMPAGENIIDTPLGKEVPLGQITKELKKLWVGDASRTRASLTNICVYSEKSNSIEENSKLLEKVTRENACRAIVFGFVKDTEENIAKAWINAHCHLKGGKKAVCSEQIAFQISAGYIGRLRNLVFSHVDSDLPLNFWWRGDISPRFEEKLYSIIDRFIYDSSEWRDPKTAYDTILKASEEVTPRMILHDLEWARSYCIRNTFARLFDHPGMVDKIGQIQSIKVTAESHHGVAAGLLVAWFATQAGWSLKSSHWGETWNSTFTNAEGNEINAVINFEDNIEPISLFEINLGGDDTIKIEREFQENFLQESVNIGDWVFKQVTPADSDDCSKLVGDTMSRSAKNILFKKILPMLKGMMS